MKEVKTYTLTEMDVKKALRDYIEAEKEGSMNNIHPAHLEISFTFDDSGTQFRDLKDLIVTIREQVTI